MNDCKNLLGTTPNAKVSMKPSQLQIEKVSNGYIIGGYGQERRISMTIAEALEIIRKEME